MKKLYLLTIFLSVFAQSQFKLIKSYGSYPLAPLRSIDGTKDMWKGKLFYQAGGFSNNPCPLMVYDGNTNGPVIVKNLSNVITTSAQEYAIQDFYSGEKWMFFTFNNNATNRIELWRTDGTEGNTLKIDEGVKLRISSITQNRYNDQRYSNPWKTELNGFLCYFKDGSLWTTDGNPSSAKLVDTFLNDGFFMVFNNKFYFKSAPFYGANVVYNYSKIYRYDGTNLEIVNAFNNGNYAAGELLGCTINKIFMRGTIDGKNGIFSIDKNDTFKQEFNDNTTYFRTLEHNYATGQSNDYGIYFTAHGNYLSGHVPFLYFCSDDGVKEVENLYNKQILAFSTNNKLNIRNLS